MADRLLSTWHQMMSAIIEHAPYVMVALLVILIGAAAASVMSKLIIRLGRNTRLDETLAVLLARLSGLGIFLLGALIAAVIALPNFRPVDMLTGLGIASIAVGFALKEILQNFFAGILILWRKPFQLGDEIRAGAFAGIVEDINIRATRIFTYEGTVAIVPNAQIYPNPVEVVTAAKLRRVELIVGIGYQDSIDRAKYLIMQVLQSTEGVRRSAVYLAELAPSSVNLRIHFWTESPQSNVLQVTDAVLSKVKQELDKAGVDIPYPHQVVLFHNTTGTRQGDQPLPGATIRTSDTGKRRESA